MRRVEHDRARRDAVLAMLYQMGPEGVWRFKNMREALDRGAWASAAYHALDSRWARDQTPERAKAVASMLSRGDYLEG